MEAQGEELLRSSGVKPDAVRHERSADMRFVGQGFEVRVTLPDDGASPVDAFHDAYRRKYGRSGPDVDLEVLTWRVVSRGPRPTLDLRSGAGGHRGATSAKGTRPVWVAGRGFEQVPVLDRYALQPGERIQGPAIVEERESTLVIADKSICSVGDDLSLTIALEEDG
jgi:N-methylhydantoinase A